MVSRRLTLECDSGVARITLTRGERGNAIDMTFAEQLVDAAREVLDASMAGDLRVVTVEAEGKIFCVGGDLEDFPSDPEAVVPHLTRMAGLMHGALDLIMAVPVPVVTRVQGVAAGAGLGLVACGDVVVASEAARFRSAYTAVGLCPDLGVSWLLPRIIGPRRAADMVLTNRMVSAAEAGDWGLVSRVVTGESLEAATEAIVAELVALPVAGLVESKRLLAEASERSLHAHLEDEAETIARLSAREEARQARESFLARA